MSDSKILKAKCQKTGRYSALELKKCGNEWKVVNMIPLTDEEAQTIASEIRQPVYKTHECLLDCAECGSRKVGGCQCLSKKITCMKNMKYQFECIYCSEFRIDYSRSGLKSGGPYTKWAGISNIPSAAKDSFGNPMGSEYDLAVDRIFRGYKILIVNLCNIILHTNLTSAEKRRIKKLKMKGQERRKLFTVFEMNCMNEQFNSSKKFMKTMV